MSRRRRPRAGHRWAKRADFYVTIRTEFGARWHIVRIRGRMGVWIGTYPSATQADQAIVTAAHQRTVDVPIDAESHPLFIEAEERYRHRLGKLYSVGRAFSLATGG